MAEDRTGCMASKYFPDIPAISGDRLTRDGSEMTFAVNYLGPFQDKPENDF
jgi:hypothetical protein